MTEKEAVPVVQRIAVKDGPALPPSMMFLGEELAALATLTLANRIHMQALKGELADLRERLEANDVI